MSVHVPEALLMRFVAGEVEDAAAASVAEHLDACELCAGRAAKAEALTRVFEALPAPKVPADLVQAVLADAARPEPAPVAEVAVGVGLLLLALVLMGAGEDPVQWLLLATRVAHALERGAHAVGLSSVVGAVGVVALLGGAALLWRGRGFALADVGGAR